ncbi:MAG: hypothetical protein NC215_00415 [Ruminococcus sp.]|nr:hypothetical protein [Ruminococcus sp.]
MNSRMKNAIIFLSGTAIGAVSTYAIVKKKFAQIAEEEIQSVKEAFSRKEKPDSGIEKEDDTEMDEYIDILGNSNYVASPQRALTKEDEPFNERPYVISPEEFDELDSYEAISLTYYADGVLTDDCNELVEDVDDVVGLDSLNHFGEYEDDSVFVRNDRYKCDYEILKDLRNYSDIVKSKPHPMEDE